MGRALIFYSPICEFSYPLVIRIAESIREVAPQLPLEFLNEWERPEESTRRRRCKVIVNARPIKTFFMEKEKFQREVREALKPSI